MDEQEDRHQQQAADTSDQAEPLEAAEVAGAGRGHDDDGGDERTAGTLDRPR